MSLGGKVRRASFAGFLKNEGSVIAMSNEIFDGSRLFVCEEAFSGGKYRLKIFSCL